MTETEFEEIALMLPFYANGTLDAAGKARVSEALAQNASLREELEDVKALSNLVEAGGNEWEAAREPADEARLTRLMERVAAEPKAAAETAPAPKKTQRVVKMEPEKPGFFASLFQPAWKPAFAAMALVAVAQGTMLYDNLGPANNRDGTYQTASGQEASGYRLLISIAPGASWSDIQALLSEYELSIVDGPSDGFIEVATGVDLSKADQRELEAKLKASPAIADVLKTG